MRLRQAENDIEWQVLARGPSSTERDDLKALTEYFNLHEPLAAMSRDWADKDPRFRLISPYFPGPAMSEVLEFCICWKCCTCMPMKRLSQDMLDKVGMHVLAKLAQPKLFPPWLQSAKRYSGHRKHDCEHTCG